MSTETAVGTLALLLAMMGHAQTQSTGPTEATGRHSVHGTIASVDQKKGWIHLKTDEGTLVLKVPPGSVRTAKKGDTMTVALALKDKGPAQRSGR
ncbi:MAG TPA: hypothetical protein VF197_17815 [Methylomirabilota bacterium]